jgi:hypothetical protein
MFYIGGDYVAHLREQGVGICRADGAVDCKFPSWFSEL